MSLLSWLKKNIARDDAWITVHPNSGTGRPVLLDDEGYIKGGMGGKFTGQRIDLIPRKSGYGAPVSESNQLNKSTPGFLRTDRYTLKAPQNAASHATHLTAEQSAKVTANQEYFERQLNELKDFFKSHKWSTEGIERRSEEARKELGETVQKIYTNDKLTDDQKDRMATFLTNSAIHYKIRLEPTMYNDPNDHRTSIMRAKIKAVHDALEGKTTDSPPSLGGVSKGEPMGKTEADTSNANPRFLMESGSQTNCQTCVVAYEARRRGYDVEATLNKRNSFNERISQDWRSPFYEVETGLPIRAKTLEGNTPQKAEKWLMDNTRPGERYVMSLEWKDGGGHVVNVERDASGVHVIDAQSGLNGSAKDYMKLIKLRGREPPELLRVDNAGFNPDICDRILKPKGGR